MNLTYTIWKGDTGGIAKLLGHPLRRASAGHEVNQMMKIYTKWRASDMSRTSNRIALPPFKVTVDKKSMK